jgi:hypothetical protein
MQRLLPILILLIVFGLALRFALLDSLEIKGLELYEKQVALDLIKRENSYLKERVLQKSSLTEIERSATPSGFVTPRPNQYLYSN